MKRERVAVAMSGGVDSSIAALLLKNRGYEVIGITMQLLPKDEEEKFGGCCGIDAIECARKVAHKLKIKHYVLNFRDFFRKTVIENFIEVYQQGKTPNPCIRCNQFIKFDLLLQRAKQIKADFIATGHYARIERIDDGRPRRKASPYHRLWRATGQVGFQRGRQTTDDKKEAKIRYLLKKGIDAKKDQSYVLYTMTQRQLKNTLFPLGDFTKDEVMKMAHRQKLPSAERKESQEICFIPDNNYPEFIKRYTQTTPKPGPILNIDGESIGQHKGLIYYTVGQRKRIGLAAKRPLYVIKIDKDKNSITVAEEKYLYRKEFTADNVHYTSFKKPNSKFKAEVKIRYLHKPAAAVIYPGPKNKVEVKFKEPQKAITSGQAAVFYDKDIVLGGGIIENISSKS